MNFSVGMKQPAYRSPRKRKGQGAERREEILNSAERLFGDRGLQAVSTRQIAEAAGISQPALYAYFATKDDIIDTLYSRAFEALETRLRNALEAVDPADRLMTIGREYVAFGLSNPDAYRVAFMIERPDESPTQAPKTDIGMGCFAMLRDAVREHCASRPGLAYDPEIIAESCWATVHGLTSLLIARREFPWVDRPKLVETHLALLAKSMDDIVA